MTKFIDFYKDYLKSLNQLISAYENLEKLVKENQALNSYLNLSKIEFDRYQELRTLNVAHQDLLQGLFKERLKLKTPEQDPKEIENNTQEIEKVNAGIAKTAKEEAEIMAALPWLASGKFSANDLNNFQPPVDRNVFAKYMAAVDMVISSGVCLEKAQGTIALKMGEATVDEIEKAKKWAATNIAPRLEIKLSLEKRLFSTFQRQLFDAYNNGLKDQEEAKVENKNEKQKDQAKTVSDVAKQSHYRELFPTYVREKISPTARIKSIKSPLVKTKTEIDKINRALKNVSLDDKQDSTPSLMGLFKQVGIQFTPNDLKEIMEIANVENEGRKPAVL